VRLKVRGHEWAELAEVWVGGVFDSPAQPVLLVEEGRGESVLLFPLRYVRPGRAAELPAKP
jgi:hypothetical protein